MTSFEREWALLQNQFDSYEKYSLIIKLVSVGLFFLGLLFNMQSISVFVVVLVLWLQDAIWKTFQARIGDRLLQLEQYIRQLSSGEDSLGIAYQFNCEYEKNRPNNLGLILEYLKQSIRPTVGYPYFLLLLVVLINQF